MIRSPLIAAALTLALLPLAPEGAFAQKGGAAPSSAKDDDDGAPAASPVDRFETGSENIFGFTEGTDMADQGEGEISVDGIGRFGKRSFGPARLPRVTMPVLGDAPAAGADQPLGDDQDDPAVARVPMPQTGPATTDKDEAAPSRRPGRSFYRALNTKLGYQIGVTDDFSIEFGVFGDARRVRNVPDLSNKSFGAFDGLSVELKYRLIERTRENPFGLAIQVEPRWLRVADVEGRGQDTFSLETKLLADLRIIPDRLWFATNIGWEPQSGRLRGTGESERETTFSWSNALSLRIGDSTFVGAEVRYLRAYSGAYLNRLEGDALYLGPTLHHRFTKRSYVTIAYSGQVSGHDRDPDYRNRSLDLRHFERHQLRVKAGVEF